MSKQKDLRNKLIRLAHAKPKLRKDLLPLIKTSGETALVLEQMTDNGFSASSLLKDLKDDEAAFRKDVQTFADDLDVGKEVKKEMTKLKKSDLEKIIKGL